MTTDFLEGPKVRRQQMMWKGCPQGCWRAKAASSPAEMALKMAHLNELIFRATSGVYSWELAMSTFEGAPAASKRTPAISRYGVKANPFWLANSLWAMSIQVSKLLININVAVFKTRQQPHNVWRHKQAKKTASQQQITWNPLYVHDLDKKDKESTIYI